MLSFEVRKTGGESEVRKVHRDVIHIGASTGNDLVVRARGVLGRHARISVSGDELRLDVLGTAPGSDVTLNGSVVRSAALAAGDRIAIGEATITLLNGPPANPNRMSAPPPNRGRDAFSVASAVLKSPTPTPAQGVPMPTVAALNPRPYEGAPARAYEPAAPPRRWETPAEGTPAYRPDARPVTAAALAVRAPELWMQFFAQLRRPVPLEELLQELATFISTATPVHSIAFVSVAGPSAGEAVAAVWKGTLPRLSTRTTHDVKERGGHIDAFESGMRIRVYAVPRPTGEVVGALVVPNDAILDPALHDFVAHASAALGFVHAERGEPVLGEKGTSPAPTPSPMALEMPLTALAGGSLAMHNLKASLKRVAGARAPVLILGDVGSGKTVVAEVLHALSSRKGRPLIRLTATAATSASLEEELLGSTGPSPDRRRRPGRLFEADGGTLLVEEVGDLPPAMQALLFRLLEAREVVGPGGRAVPVDIRVLTTSSRSLSRAVEDGAFRDDLYYRLSALTLRLPALKDRKEDLPALLDELARRHGGPSAQRFDVDATNALLGYAFPGNVRELENEVRRLAALSGEGPITLADLDPKFSGEHVELALAETDDLKEIVTKVERQVIERVMRKVRGNQSLGARLLNISRGSLIAKMKEFDIKDFRYLKKQD